MAAVRLRNSEHRRQKAETDEDDVEDIWDDSALIEAYDRAIKSFKNANNDKNNEQDASSKVTKKKKKKDKSKNEQILSSKGSKWNIGDKCQAVYYEDGLLYSGTITDLDAERRTCVVLFDYYGNIETISFDDVYSKYDTITETNEYTEEDSKTKQAKKRGRDLPVNTWSLGDVCITYDPRAKKDGVAVITGLSGNSCDLTFTGSRSKHTAFLSSIRCTDSKKESYRHTCGRHDKDKRSYDQRMFPNFRPPFFPATNDLFFQMPPPPCFQSPCHGFPSVPRNKPSARPYDSMIPPPPPPPLPFPTTEGGDDEALASMLMSWYMVGYHTGYYQATKKDSLRAEPKSNSYQMEDSDTTSDTSTKPDC